MTNSSARLLRLAGWKPAVRMQNTRSSALRQFNALERVWSCNSGLPAHENRRKCKTIRHTGCGVFSCMVSATTAPSALRSFNAGGAVVAGRHKVCPYCWDILIITECNGVPADFMSAHIAHIALTQCPQCVHCGCIAEQYVAPSSCLSVAALFSMGYTACSFRWRYSFGRV